MRNLFGITLFENDLFVTNWRDESVYRINKFTGDSVVALKSNKSRPFAIHVYHRQKQPTVTVNGDPPCNGTNYSCQHLCVPQGVYSSTNNSSHTAIHNSVCICKAGFKSLKEGRCARKTLKLYYYVV